MTLHKSRVGKALIGTAFLTVVAVGVALFLLFKGPAQHAQAGPVIGEEHEKVEPITVKVIQPQVGGMERKTTQPGTVRAFEYEEMYAQVSGKLASQKVDLGDTVKKGQLLAEIAAPDLVKEEQHAAAELKQTRAQVNLMKASVLAARAEVDKALSAINSTKAEEKRCKAFLAYREFQVERIRSLVKDRAVVEKLLDEELKYRDASAAALDAAVAAITTAQAEVEAKKAKVLQAEADQAAAEAKVEVAEATLEKARVFVEFTRIRSQYDGVVTTRNYHPGTYIRSAEKGQSLPLFVVQRTDLMRVIVQVPDLDAPFCDVGDPADLSINSLPTTQFSFEISRIANSQAQGDRTMRVEMDVPNDKKLLRDGMYGLVTIHLQAALKDALRIPSSAVSRHDGKIRVFVVRDDEIVQLPVKLGMDNGAETEVLTGLKADDLVVLHPSQDLTDGTEVKTELEQPRSVAGSHN